MGIASELEIYARPVMTCTCCGKQSHFFGFFAYDLFLKIPHGTDGWMMGRQDLYCGLLESSRYWLEKNVLSHQSSFWSHPQLICLEAMIWNSFSPGPDFNSEKTSLVKELSLSGTVRRDMLLKHLLLTASSRNLTVTGNRKIWMFKANGFLVYQHSGSSSENNARSLVSNRRMANKHR